LNNGEHTRHFAFLLCIWSNHNSYQTASKIGLDYNFPDNSIFIYISNFLPSVIYNQIIFKAKSKSEVCREAHSPATSYNPQGTRKHTQERHRAHLKEYWHKGHFAFFPMRDLSVFISSLLLTLASPPSRPSSSPAS